MLAHNQLLLLSSSLSIEDDVMMPFTYVLDNLNQAAVDEHFANGLRLGYCLSYVCYYAAFVTNINYFETHIRLCRILTILPISVLALVKIAIGSL